MPKRTGMYRKLYKVFADNPNISGADVRALFPTLKSRTIANARSEWRAKQVKLAQARVGVPLSIPANPPDIDAFITKAEAFIARYRALQKENEHLHIEVRKWREIAGKINDEFTAQLAGK